MQEILKERKLQNGLLLPEVAEAPGLRIFVVGVPKLNGVYRRLLLYVQDLIADYRRSPVFVVVGFHILVGSCHRLMFLRL
jgi:hypothetical protein